MRPVLLFVLVLWTSPAAPTDVYEPDRILSNSFPSETSFAYSLAASPGRPPSIPSVLAIGGQSSAVVHATWQDGTGESAFLSVSSSPGPYTVATQGIRALVGYYTGSALLLFQNSRWQLQLHLDAPPNQEVSGEAVALSSECAAVSGRTAVSVGTSYAMWEPKVSIFCSSSNWARMQDVTGDLGSGFGRAMGMAAYGNTDVLAVGDPVNERVSLFTRSDGVGLFSSGTVINRPSSGWSGFGSAVFAHPGVLVIGAPLTGAATSGAVSVSMPVELSSMSQLTVCSQLSGDISGGSLGEAVTVDSSSGDIIVAVGEPGADSVTILKVSSAGSSCTANVVGKLTYTGPANSYTGQSRLGSSLAFSEQMLWAGAPAYVNLASGWATSYGTLVGLKWCPSMYYYSSTHLSCVACGNGYTSDGGRPSACDPCNQQAPTNGYLVENCEMRCSEGYFGVNLDTSSAQCSLCSQLHPVDLNGEWMDGLPTCRLSCDIGYQAQSDQCVACAAGTAPPANAVAIPDCEWQCDEGFHCNGHGCFQSGYSCQACQLPQHAIRRADAAAETCGWHCIAGYENLSPNDYDSLMAMQGFTTITSVECTQCTDALPTHASWATEGGCDWVCLDNTVLPDCLSCSSWAAARSIELPENAVWNSASDQHSCVATCDTGFTASYLNDWGVAECCSVQQTQAKPQNALWVPTPAAGSGTCWFQCVPGSVGPGCITTDQFCESNSDITLPPGAVWGTKLSTIGTDTFQSGTTVADDLCFSVCPGYLPVYGLADPVSGASECCYSPLPENADWLASCDWQCQTGHFARGLNCIDCNSWRGAAPAHANWSRTVTTGCSRDDWVCDTGYERGSRGCTLPHSTCASCQDAGYAWCNGLCQGTTSEDCSEECQSDGDAGVLIVLCILGGVLVLSAGVLLGWCMRGRMKKAWHHKSLSYLFTPDLNKVVPEGEFNQVHDNMEESDSDDDASGLGAEPPAYSTVARQNAFTARPRALSDRRIHPAATNRPRAANQRRGPDATLFAGAQNLTGANPLNGRSGPRQPLPLALSHGGRWWEQQAADGEDPALNSLSPASPLSTGNNRTNQARAATRAVRAARGLRPGQSVSGRVPRAPPAQQPADPRVGNPYAAANGASAYEQQAQGWLQAANHTTYPSRSTMSTPRLPTSPAAFITSLPEVTMTSQMLSEDGKSDNDSCCICLEDYAPKDRVRVLPCLHRFHSSCIGSWACKQNTCPLCNDTIFRGL